MEAVAAFDQALEKDPRDAGTWNNRGLALSKMGKLREALDSFDRGVGLDPDDPKVGRYLPLAMEAFGRPEVLWIGETSVYEPWENVNEVVIQSLDIIEEAYAFSDWWFSALTAMDPYFPLKKKGYFLLFLRKLLAPFKRIFYKYDYL